MNNSATIHPWKFFRTGGLDQVALTTGADLQALPQLDQKLWVALSCPVRGLELDEKTLALIDSDSDGRIRVPELLAAVSWASSRLLDPVVLLDGHDGLPLAAINTNTPDGAILAASARQILASLGQKDATKLTVADTTNTAKIFSASLLNGDGIIPPEAASEPATQVLIRDIIACVGGTIDRTGAIGITAEKVDVFFQELTAHAEWLKKGAAPGIAGFGPANAAAFTAVQAVRLKVEDYFTRTRLAAFDARALAALNRNETDYLALAAKDLSHSAAELSGFPLARVEVGRPLPLLDHVNPAWAHALAELHALTVTPLFGAAHTTLTPVEWATLNTQLTPYKTWLETKAGPSVEKLGIPRIQEILSGSGRATLTALIAHDKALEPEFRAIADVERLVRYHRDLRALLHNFVNFADFYSSQRSAVFQAGTLFLDSRSTELCLRVDGPNPLAAMSKAYITYCTCTRAGSPPMTIAACFTQGDSDYLFIGRHGVFYDRAGRDWDTVITSIVDNPIGIRQAFWSPYKKFIRFVEEQVAKRAAAADAEANGKIAAAAEKSAYLEKSKAEPPKKIDVGAVAAIGVAITGAVSALTLILGYIFSLALWQYPLVLVGLILTVSGPSMIIAWLKLRQRTIGPILEGNGWAVNGRVKINLPFGTALTDVAVLPEGAQRSLKDPYEDKAAAQQGRRVTALIIIVALATIAGVIRWKRLESGRYFWAATPPIAAPAVAAPVQTPEPAAKK